MLKNQSVFTVSMKPVLRGTVFCCNKWCYIAVLSANKSVGFPFFVVQHGVLVSFSMAGMGMWF